MIDHFTVSVADLAKSREFYAAVLAPLGYKPLMEWEQYIGFGDTRPYFWLKQAMPVTTPQHIAFRANTRALVDAFHKAALEAGARDDGAPGLRLDYHENYYGAFVVDPLNGHPLEAVCHLPLGAAPRATRTAKKASARKPVAKKKVAARGKRKK